MDKPIESILERIDWSSYEDRVFTALQEAVQKYNRLYRDDQRERVSQISIWTDPQAKATSIDFETHSNFLDRRKYQANEHRQRMREEMALRVEAMTYQGNPAEFKHTDFIQIDNPELSFLEIGDSEDQEYDVLQRINLSLLKVVQRANGEHTFVGLWREPTIVVGVNSPLDWYDSIQML